MRPMSNGRPMAAATGPAATKSSAARRREADITQGLSRQRCGLRSRFPTASSAFSLCRFYDGIKGGFWLATAVEQHGVFGSASDRPVVAPGLAVMHGPKCDPAKLVPIL